MALQGCAGGEVEARGHPLALQGEVVNAVDHAVQALQRFPRTPPQAVPVGDVKARAEFQARNLELVRAGSVQAVKDQRADLVASIRRDLEADPAHFVEPVWVADIDGAWYVLDGFHRLHAFKLAKRETIPARVLPMNHSEALAVSLLVNEGDRRLPRMPGERTEAAWQTVGLLTDRGAHALPRGWTAKRIARTYRVHVNTLTKMGKALVRIAGVPLDEFKSHEINQQTGWITWKAAYTHGRTFGDESRERFTSVQEKEIERIRQRLGRDLERIRDWGRKQDPRLYEEAVKRIQGETEGQDDEALAMVNLAEMIDRPEGMEF